MGGLSIATRGILGGGGSGGGEIIVIDVAPIVGTAELRPTMFADQPGQSTSQNAPVVIASEELRPVMRSADDPSDPTSQATPEILSTDDLRPVMRKAEEE